MRYFWGVLIPVLLQGLLVFITIEMNTGNGSWLGLGALLIGMFTIPGTAIVNFLIVRNSSQASADVALVKCWLAALIAPFFILGFFLFA